MKKYSFIYIMLIVFSVFYSACDKTDEQDNATEPVAGDTPVWETTVITPSRVVAYSSEGLAADANYGFNDPAKALGLPYGSGESAGSLDVVSLGFDENGAGGYIVLEFEKTIINGTGVDFKIFENVMKNSDGSYFIEAAIVYLSEDGITWHEFPAALSGDSTSATDISEPAKFSGYAGIAPVLSNWKKEGSPKPEDSNSGGDFFDLEDMTSPIKENGFRFIKIVDAGVLVNDPGNEKDTDGDYVYQTSGFDLDAVVGINYE